MLDCQHKSISFSISIKKKKHNSYTTAANIVVLSSTPRYLIKNKLLLFYNCYYHSPRVRISDMARFKYPWHMIVVWSRDVKKKKTKKNVFRYFISRLWIVIIIIKQRYTSHYPWVDCGSNQLTILKKKYLLHFTIKSHCSLFSNNMT